MKAIVWVQCPHCGHEFCVSTEHFQNVVQWSEHGMLVECPFDEAGCGNRFVVDIKVTLSATTHKIAS